MIQKKSRTTKVFRKLVPLMGFLGVCVFLVYLFGFAPLFPVHYSALADVASTTVSTITPDAPIKPVLNREEYDRLLWRVANNGSSTAKWKFNSATGIATNPNSTSTASTTASKKYAWPTKAPYPLAGALLPFNRIIAYYGNFYSKGMGVLGQYPKDVMLSKLSDEIAKWNEADPEIPAIPAIDYIAVTAQGSAGADGKYRLRMPDSQIDHALELADEVHGIVILDVQVGLSTLQVELPQLKKYLSMPNVHLAIDPEFSMKSGDKPGSVIGTFNAADVNYTSQYLAQLVQENNLPPKVLVVHRFTQGMVKSAKQITPLPEVQIVMDMDGWGSPAKKIGTYKNFVAAEPVQFTGFKLFYKNDLRTPSTRILTPKELLQLTPQPLFIQFQ